MKRRWLVAFALLLGSGVGLELGRQALAAHQLASGLQALDGFKLTEAEKFIGRAVWLRPESHQFRAHLAACRMARGDARGAEELLATLDREALSPAQALGSLLLAAEIDLAAGRGEEALAGLEDLLSVLRRVDGSNRELRKIEIRALRSLGQVLELELGRIAEAEQRLLEALHLARKLNLETERAWVQLDLAAWARGRRRQVERRIEEQIRPALQSFEASGHVLGHAAALMALARIAREQEDLPLQSELLAQAAELYQGTGHLLGPALLEYARANRDVSLERDAESHERYMSARQQFLELGQLSGVRVSDMGLAWLKLRSGQLDDARALLEQLLPELGPNVYRRYVLWLSGHVDLHTGDPAGAVEAYAEVLELDRTLAVEDLAYSSNVWSMLGQAGLQLGDLGAADRALAEARRLAGDRGEVNALVVALLASADLEALHMKAVGLNAQSAQKHAARSLNFLEAAIELLEVNLDSSLSPFHFTHFLQTQERLRSLLLDWYLPEAVKARAHEAVFRTLELMRHRRQDGLQPGRGGERVPSAAEIASLRQLTAWLGDEKATANVLRTAYRHYAQAVIEAEVGFERPETVSRLARSRPASLQQLQAALDQRAAVVFYAFAKTEAFALLVGSEAAVAVALPVGVQGLQDRVRLLVDLLVSGASTFSTLSAGEAGVEGWRPIAEELHEALITPLYAAGLGRDMDLGIVPIGSMSELPFASLIAEDGSFLIENHLLWTAPSAAAMLTTGTDPENSRRLVSRRLAAFGVDQGVEGPKLSLAVAEAQEIAAAIGGRAWLASAATEHALRRQLPARLIHIAAHGEVEMELPLFSRLALAPDTEAGEDPERDGRLTVDEILALNGQSELIVLSSCRASASFSPRSEDWAAERLGLGGAFLVAGARQVISSQLPIADGGARELMLDLYRELSEHPPAVALNRVQRRHAQGDEMTWIGFGLMGALPDRDADAFLSVGGE